MDGLTVVTWRWGSKYGPEYVERLRAGVARHLKQDYDFLVAEPLVDDIPLTLQKGCFARLRMFDQFWQIAQGFPPGHRIVCMDLDMVITGPLDDLFDRPEPFTILQGVNSANPCPFNGSLWMLRARYRPDVWDEFSIELAAKVPFYEFPDDQAWFADMMPDAGKFGPEDGVYAFFKPGWPKGEALPKNARIVAFPGARDPAQFTHLPWVQENWR